MCIRSARLVVMNSVDSNASSVRLPSMGTPNSSTPMPMINVGLNKSHQHVGQDLAEHHLDRRDRHRQQALHGAPLDLARHRERREDQHGHGQDGADEAGHDVQPRRSRRIVARMRPDFEWRIGWIADKADRARARSARSGRARSTRSRRRRDRWHRRQPVAPDGHRAAPRARSRAESRHRTAPCRISGDCRRYRRRAPRCVKRK